MRTIDESFQRLMSKRYDCDLGNIQKSKSLFESFDECDKLDRQEALKENDERNFVFQNGSQAKDLFDKIYTRGYQGAGNDAETKKAIPAYNEVVKLLNAGAGADTEALVKAYDQADPKVKLAVSKLIRVATTWDKYGDEVAKSYDEALNKKEDIEPKKVKYTFDSEIPNVYDRIDPNSVPDFKIKDKTDESLDEAEAEIEKVEATSEPETSKVSEEDEKDFEDRIWQKLPSAVKQSLNDAWDNRKTNEKFFEIYLQALVDADILDAADRDSIIKSNEAYGYTDKKTEALQEGKENAEAAPIAENDETLTEDSKALSKDELCKKWGCAPEDFDAMCAEGSGNLAEPGIN